MAPNGRIRMRAAREIVRDQLEELARMRAREMLVAALKDGRDAYLGRGHYERTGVYRGYRSGSTARRPTRGSGTVELEVPRIRDIPPEQEPFESKIIRKSQHRSDTIDETSMKLFIEGLATRDFEPALRLLVGERAPLSLSTLSTFAAVTFSPAAICFMTIQNSPSCPRFRNSNTLDNSVNIRSRSCNRNQERRPSAARIW